MMSAKEENTRSTDTCVKQRGYALKLRIMEKLVKGDWSGIGIGNLFSDSDSGQTTDSDRFRSGAPSLKFRDAI